MVTTLQSPFSYLSGIPATNRQDYTRNIPIVHNCSILCLQLDQDLVRYLASFSAFHLPNHHHSKLSNRTLAMRCSSKLKETSAPPTNFLTDRRQDFHSYVTEPFLLTRVYSANIPHYSHLLAKKPWASILGVKVPELTLLGI